MSELVIHNVTFRAIEVAMCASNNEPGRLILVFALLVCIMTAIFASPNQRFTFQFQNFSVLRLLPIFEGFGFEFREFGLKKVSVSENLV